VRYPWTASNPVYFFCKFFKRPDCIVHGVALFWRVGLATRVAGVSFFRAFNEASEGPCLRGCGGLGYGAGLASVGLWAACGGEAPSDCARALAGLQEPWRGTVRGAGNLPSPVRRSHRYHAPITTSKSSPVCYTFCYTQL
jgi:hypothetical protein